MTHPLKGKKQSPEHVAKRAAALRASGTYERTKLRMVRNTFCVGRKHSSEHKKRISLSMKGKRNALGFKRSEEFRRKLSEYWKNNPEKHNHYKDGKHPERSSERVSAMGKLEYRLWRSSVFARDDFTCVRCGQRGGGLHADHIKLWSKFPELRYAIDNGRTLCVPCHISRRKWEEVNI